MKLKNIILTAFIFSGAAALIYEVAWIRPLQFTLGSTIYTTSIIFAAFMAGLALGSFIITKFIDKIKNLVKAYALMELGIGLYGILLLSLFNLLPKIYNLIYALRENFILFEVVHFVLTFILLLIPTTLMGGTFPVIAKFYTTEKIGKGIGEIYAANNIGAILGSFAAGFLLIPIFGIKSTIILAGIINVLIASVLLFIVAKDYAKKIVPIALLLFLILAYFGDYNIKQMHSGGFYRTDPIVKQLGDVVYYKEGLHATITVRELTKPQAKALFINGKGQGSTEVLDLRVNFLLSYLPLLFNPESKNALVIGLGTGTTSGQLAQFVKVKTIEIEPAILDAARYFGVANLDILENPTHELIIDDGRNYLLKDKEKYDIIAQEPSDPWQSFSTQLYSKEFFELVKDHLNENGLFVKWLPIYTMSVDDFRNFYKTFSLVFLNNIAFANIKEDEDTPVKFRTSEIIFIGSKNKINIDENKLRNNFENLPSGKDYLNAIKLGSINEILHLLLFTDREMKNYADNAKLITDDNSILEFSTSRKVLYKTPEEIINDIEVFLKSG